MRRDPVDYKICIRGLLGELFRSAFPDLQARAQDRDTVLSGMFPTRPPCTGSSPGSRNSAWNWSRSAACREPVTARETSGVNEMHFPERPAAFRTVPLSLRIARL